MTTPVYTTTGAYWYSKQKFPQGLPIKGPEDLKGYKLCGILGYNYTGYRIPPEMVTYRPKTYQAAFSMVSLGRCDLFLSNIPTVIGKTKLGELTLPEDVEQRVQVCPRAPFIFSSQILAARSPCWRINQDSHPPVPRVTDVYFLKHLPQCGRHCSQKPSGLRQTRCDLSPSEVCLWLNSNHMKAGFDRRSTCF